MGILKILFMLSLLNNAVRLKNQELNRKCEEMHI